MGSRNFQTHILYYHDLGMTYTSKIILPDGFNQEIALYKRETWKTFFALIIVRTI